MAEPNPLAAAPPPKRRRIAAEAVASVARTLHRADSPVRDDLVAALAANYDPAAGRSNVRGHTFVVTPAALAQVLSLPQGKGSVISDESKSGIAESGSSMWALVEKELLEAKASGGSCSRFGMLVQRMMEFQKPELFVPAGPKETTHGAGGDPPCRSNSVLMHCDVGKMSLSDMENVKRALEDIVKAKDSAIACKRRSFLAELESRSHIRECCEQDASALREVVCGYHESLKAATLAFDKYRAHYKGDNVHTDKNSALSSVSPSGFADYECYSLLKQNIENIHKEWCSKFRDCAAWVVKLLEELNRHYVNLRHLKNQFAIG